MKAPHAIRLGLRRGWLEFVQSIRSSQDQGFYLFTAFLAVGYLFLRRNTEIEGTDLLLPSVALPSILGAFVAFERESQENGPGMETTTTTNTVGIVFAPNVVLMAHLFL